MSIDQFDKNIQSALREGLLVDITTIGRTTYRPHRIEIWFHNVRDEIFITGAPGRRDWYANILVDPRMTLHLKESIQVDIEARAIVVQGKDIRARIMRVILAPNGAFATMFKGRNSVFSEAELDRWILNAPLVKVTPIAIANVAQ